MNIKNRTIFCNDNLHVLRGIDTASVDLIYLDPPFNSNRNYEAPIDSEAAGTSFNDTWALSDADNEWHSEIADSEPALYQVIHTADLTHSKGMKAYLIMMAVRLIEMRRVLKDTGSIYLHCDPTSSHYLKSLMDSIFGHESYRNEIVWKRAGAGRTGVKKKWAEIQDRILFYTKTKDYIFERLFTKPDEQQLQTFIHTEPETQRIFKTSSLGDYTEKSIRDLESKNMIYVTKNGKKRKKYYLDESNFSIGTIWNDIPWVASGSYERTGYPTQKPLKLLQRIIRASSNQGDMVLDPFCGAGTVCVAAEKMGRQWIGIDISPLAIKLVKNRLDHEVGFLGETIVITDVPKRSEI